MPQSIASPSPLEDRPTLLVVNAVSAGQEMLKAELAPEFTVYWAAHAQDAERVLAAGPISILLCDLGADQGETLTFLKGVRSRWPQSARVMVARRDPDTVRRALAEDDIHGWIPFPWEPLELKNMLQEVLDQHARRPGPQALSGSNSSTVTPLPNRAGSGAARQEDTPTLRAAAAGSGGFGKILHAMGGPMELAIDTARRIAGFDISVLITGASGTGKELLARAIHGTSPRADQAFVAENCGALPDQLLESELFGCRRGAFTDAFEDRVGLFEKAHGGTIFLDEIGETSQAFQVKLLRVLQEGEIRPLGMTTTRSVDVRVIAATNRDLEAEVAAGRFRRDLYYRIAGFPIHLPCLADRPDDLPLLAERFLRECSTRLGKTVTAMAPEVFAALKGHHWPGNVRELQNEIQRMVALTEGAEITLADMSPRLRPHRGVAPVTVDGDGGGTLKDRVEALEATVIAEGLERCEGNISRLAESLGLSRVGLRGKMKRYGLDSGV